MTEEGAWSLFCATGDVLWYLLYCRLRDGRLEKAKSA